MDQTKGRLQTTIGSRSPKKIVLFGVILLAMLLVGAVFMASRGIVEAVNSTIGQPDAVKQSSLVKGGVDSDVPAFLMLAEQATRKANQVTPEATLRQVIVDLETAAFFFTDAAATQEFVVKVPVGNGSGSLDHLTVEMTNPAIARYVDRPSLSLNLSNLRIGSDRVKQAITQLTPGCDFSHLVLYSEADILIWIAFCATDEGLVSGRMNNQTGVFRPESLAPWPLVATPNP